MSEIPVSPALKECAAIIRDGSKSFHAASLLLPRRIRYGAYGLYAFCRVSDDVVDIDGASEASVKALNDRLDAIYDGRRSGDPVDKAFAEVVNHYDIPKALPAALIDGFLWDVDGRQYQTIVELYDYAARVAGSVGAMMAVLMGARSTHAIARACDLGVAMQLTNIARDIGEDARNGRIYLPLDWFAELELDPEDWLKNPIINDEIKAMTRRLLEVAEYFYETGLAGVEFLPADCRPGIKAAAEIYAAIGKVIARNDYDSVSTRAVVSTRRKLYCVAKSIAWPHFPDAAEKSPPLEANAFLVNAAGSEPRSDWAGDGVMELIHRLERRDRSSELAHWA
ncbi:MAG: phytoene/squalene synthase family protein [Pseudomonadota bacterium]